MDKLVPPPNGSPEEIQAWSVMMDTMVTFIKASTNLMNIITHKARYTSSVEGIKIGDVVGGCEPECEACKPKPPCGICGKTEELRDAPKSALAIAEKEGVSETPEEDPIVTEAPTDDSEMPTDEPPNQVDEPPNESPLEVPPETVPDVSSPSEERKQSITPSSNETKCVCAAIKAKRLADQKKDRCNCLKKKSKQKRNQQDIMEEEEEEFQQQPAEEEKLCACGPTEGNKDFMVKDMMEKLASAQQEITKLQGEMARLQRMDASKRVGPHGGPNPAALYKEIVKDSELYNEFPCVPCDDSNRRPPPGSYGKDSGYWSRLGDFGSGVSPGQRHMVVCPSLRSSVPSPRRQIICGPPSRVPPASGQNSCDPNCII
ncbi:hypothetical protein ABEB36_001301 [Hypothenemus hampei]|uniref:Uncharacterized protein n=1 Tax=Hypothenemus hampei TaxID=57062 RepID=A0ABD1FE57_HYPHA